MGEGGLRGGLIIFVQNKNFQYDSVFFKPNTQYAVSDEVRFVCGLIN